jgi:hypothetical protein
MHLISLAIRDFVEEFTPQQSATWRFVNVPKMETVPKAQFHKSAPDFGGDPDSRRDSNGFRRIFQNSLTHDL